MPSSAAAARAFYRPGEPAAAIFLEKAAILRGPDAARYRLLSPAGDAALREFCAAVGVPLTDPDMNGSPEARLRAVTLALEPDLLLLAPPRWELVWASVCFPTRWSLAGKLGRPLGEIHGAVPGLNAALGRGIETFFARLAPGAGWERANWGLTASAARDQHPALAVPVMRPDSGLADVLLSIERQHFLKLPASGAVAFGIRVVRHRLDRALATAGPAVRAGLCEKLRTMPPEVAAYKGIPPDWWRRLL